MILVVDGIQVVVWPVSGRLPDGRIARRGRHESIRPGSASLWPCKPFALVNGVEVHPVPGARRRFPRDDGCGRRDDSWVPRPGAFHRHSSLPSPSIRPSRPSVEGNRTRTAFVAAETGESLVPGPEAVNPLPRRRTGQRSGHVLDGTEPGIARPVCCHSGSPALPFPKPAAPVPPTSSQTSLVTAAAGSRGAFENIVSLTSRRSKVPLVATE